MPGFSEDVWKSLVEHIFVAKEFTPDMLSAPEVRSAIDETCRILTHGVDSAIKRQVPQELIDHLHNDTFLFSGFKTYHTAREISAMLLDPETGSFKNFDKFFNEVRSIDERYNHAYLQAEYNFAVQSTQMAVKWHDFEQDGDRYLLQYRTANDGNVRPEHQALHNTTLPIGDPFWDSYTPPLGWNCRCTVVQVRRGKYPESDSATAIRAGEAATAKPKQRIFRFNPGKTERIFPPKHPYLPKGCGDCQYRKQRRLGYNPDNPMCQACDVLAKCAGKAPDTITYDTDKEAYKERRTQVRDILYAKGDYKDNQNTYFTGHIYMGNDNIKCVLNHCHSSNELDAAANLHDILTNMRDGKYLPIDTSRPNYKKKILNDGIRHFVSYNVKVSGEEFILKCKAVRYHGLMEEQPYSLKEKK